MSKIILQDINEKILGRWVNQEIEYIFCQDNTFYVVLLNKEKQIRGFYAVKENVVELCYNNYKETWKGHIDFINENELLIRDLSNEIGKTDNLKRLGDNMTLKKIPPSGATCFSLHLAINEIYYPILLMNDEVKDALNNDKTFQRPLEPVFKSIEPEPSYGIFLYFILIIIGIVIFFHFESFFIFGLLFIFIGIYLVFQNPGKKKYIIKKEKYERDKELYFSKCKVFKKEILLSDIEFNLLRRKEHLKQVLQKNTYSTSVDYIKGLSHDLFLKKLVLTFGDKKGKTKGILESLSYQKNNFSYQVSYKPYVSDFAYLDEETGLVLLIEIDEPYTLKNKEAIHLNDNDRNSFFMELNWVIIRFSEEQVLFHSDECCKFISEVILKFENPNNYNDRLFHKLPLIEKWNDLNICRLINSNYRENYLRKASSEGLINFTHIGKEKTTFD